MNDTSIEWTDLSANPIRARVPGGRRHGHYCEKISPGCRNCYSSRLQPRFGLPVFQEQRGDQRPEVYFEPRVLEQVLRRRKPSRIFWADMTDLFCEWVPFEWIAACFGVMAATPQHTHQVLTKRPARALEFFAWLRRGGLPARLVGEVAIVRDAADAYFDDGEHPTLPLGRAWPLHNVHLGVSCEDQQRADERIPLLLQCPAAVRWVSAEPLLGDIDFLRVQWPGKHRVDVLRGGAWDFGSFPGFTQHSDMNTISWIVVGGESGPGARPCDVAWVRSIVEQCKAADVRVFMKQLGANVEHNGIVAPGQQWGRPGMGDRDTGRGNWHKALIDRKGGDPAEWPADLRVREFPR